jgi:hypothetical protein
MSRMATTAQRADTIDYWVRRHLFQYCYGAHPSQSEGKRKPPWDKGVVISAIGQRLKDQYALATSVPPQLTALVKQLESAEVANFISD